ncbi:helix-turn-helix domain-containing protein [Roseospira visakhapatnamensis]|uniref:Chromosomal replication initiation ATPase DnaA n=1 Tax=Roseospira visakhapatnamensis TaxID=390880 RepID=A0A7W6RH58_9PROT|nr:helix-turn-helix domain-containing protein [Roseospira visakhapatnamensis]MBB4267793.1 chromosomal replication initiation ATPase DnaA [Roseospira visakhapatnamensis]
MTDHPTIAQIVAVVAEVWGVSPAELRSRRCGQPAATARQAAMALARDLTPHTAATIGRAIGDRDRTTVTHAIRRTHARAASDADTCLRLALARIALAAQVFAARMATIGTASTDRGPPS